MDDRHQPRPDFVANLEWQVRTAHRRRSRFAEPARRNGGNMKLASVVLVSALIGAGGMAVSEEVQESRQQEILLARVDTELRLAELQVAVVRSQLEQTGERMSAGVVGEETFLSARMAYREALARLESLTLDREEIRITGKEPDNRLGAPLVDGRDFVRERMDLQVSVHEQHLQLVSLQLARLQDLEATGAIRAGESQEGVMALNEARIQLEALLERLQIRDRFREGDVSGEEAVREAETVDATRDLRIQEMARDLAALRVQRLEERGELGLIHEAELERARLKVMEMELARELALLRLRELGGVEGV